MGDWVMFGPVPVFIKTGKSSVRFPLSPTITMFVSFRIILSLNGHFTASSTVYNRLHLFLGLIFGTGHRTALMASSKTALRPF